MKEFTSHKPGTFCWIELATTDPENAKKFYNELFGWDFFDIPIAENNFYTLCKLNGKDVAALYGIFPEQLAMNLPPNWLPYVASNDVFYLTKLVKENNGKVITEDIFPTNNRSHAVDISNFAKGVYFIKVEGQNSIQRLKVISR